MHMIIPLFLQCLLHLTCRTPSFLPFLLFHHPVLLSLLRFSSSVPWPLMVDCLKNQSLDFCSSVSLLLIPKWDWLPSLRDLTIIYLLSTPKILFPVQISFLSSKFIYVNSLVNISSWIFTTISSSPSLTGFLSMSPPLTKRKQNCSSKPSGSPQEALIYLSKRQLCSCRRACQNIAINLDLQILLTLPKP